MSTPQTEVQPAGWYDDPAGQARFRYWDGRHWTHQTTNAKSPESGAPALGAGFARLGDWLGRGMALIALAAFVVVLAIAWAASEVGADGVDLSSGFAPTSSGFATVDHSRTDSVAVVLLAAFGAYTVASMAASVVFVVWQYQLARSAPAQLRRTPVMHVVSWFIPVLSCWWPYQNMVDLWHAYDGRVDRRTPDVASGIGLWWAALLGLPFVAGFAGGFLLASADTQNLLGRLAIFYAGLYASSIVSALLARGVVNRLSWRALEYCASVQ